MFPARVAIECGEQGSNGTQKFPLDTNPDAHLCRKAKIGMSVTAEIPTGRRRILDYLLSPMIETVHESSRER